MSNLLKDASILLTPEGYDNGSMNAIKPGDGDGDFTFVRGSAATRVNAQGLVEDVQVISSNLVTNGDFSQEGSELVTNGDFATDSDWSKLNATISGGLGNLNGTGVTSLLFQNILTDTKTYTATFTISNYNGLGDGKIINNDGDTIYTITSNGTFTTRFTHSSASGNFLFRAISGATYSVDNVSVKEIGQDWVFSTGATITDLGAKITHTPTAGTITQSGTLVIGNQYKFTYEITESVSGSLKLNSAISTSMVTSVGVHTKYFEADSVGFSIARTSAVSNDVTITNISVKEITDDTNLPRINYEGFSYQDSLGSEEIVNGDFATNDISGWGGAGSRVVDNGRLKISETTQNFSQAIYSGLDTSKKYKTTFTITRGTKNPIVYGTENGNITIFESGTYTYILENTNKFYVGTNGDNDVWYLDNVSVKEYLGQEVVPDSGSGAWLLEPQSTNLYLNSEPITNESGALGITYESFNWSLGFSNCVRYGDNSEVRFRYGASTSASTEYTLSAFVIMDDLSEPVIGGQTSENDFTFVIGGSVFDNANPSVNMGNNIYRVSVKGTTSASPNQANSGIVKYTAQSSKGFRVVGYQLEEQSYATSYIPTDGATSTRLQDKATNSGNATLINSTEGVFYVDIAALAATAEQRRIVLSDGTATYRLIIRIVGPNTISFFVGNTGNQASHTVTNVTTTSFNRMAISWKENDIKFYLNGVNVHTDTISNQFPAGVLDRIDFANPQPAFNTFFGENRTLAVYKEALTDADLRCLTYPDPVATTFDLNFKTIAEQFTFTRGSEATFVNEQGLVKSTASNNAPRIDYSTGTEAFLLEPQSTNLIAYGEDFNDSYWSRTENTTVSLSNVLAPDGIDFAYKVSASAASAALYRVSYNPTGRLTDARSIYARTVSGTGQVRLCSFNQNTNNLFTLTEEWQRFEVNSVINTAANNFYAVDFRNGTTLTEVLIWGAQAEELPYATSYIPTSGATATRNQETCVDATPVINSTEGTLYAEISALADSGITRFISISDGSTNNRVYIGFDNISNTIESSLKNNGSTQFLASHVVADTTNYHKVAVKYKANDIALWVDGVEVAVDTNSTMPLGLSSLQFTSGASGALFNGNTKGLKYYPEALADAQLEDLTKI